MVYASGMIMKSTWGPIRAVVSRQLSEALARKNGSLVTLEVGMVYQIRYEAVVSLPAHWSVWLSH